MKKKTKSTQRRIPYYIFVCLWCGTRGEAQRKRRQFCDGRCRAAFHNREREQVTEADISNWLQANPSQVPTLLNQVYATVQEAAQITGKSETTIRKWINRQKVRAENYNGRLIVLRSDLARTAEQGPHASPKAIKPKLRPLQMDVIYEQSTSIATD